MSYEQEFELKLTAQTHSYRHPFAISVVALSATATNVSVPFVKIACRQRRRPDDEEILVIVCARN